MERRLGRAIGVMTITGLALALGGCQKSAAPAANAANAAPAVANVTVTSLVAPAPPPPAAKSPDAVAAKAFLDGLYAHYKASSSTGTTWAPMDDANIKEVFDADMVRLMAADTKALKGDLGEIDGDWLCDCQDWGSIAATVTVTSASPTEAKAVAEFHDTQVAGEAPKRDSFDLVKTPAGWRIHDMGTADQPSLRAVLTKEIADLKSGKTKPLNETDGPP